MSPTLVRASEAHRLVEMAEVLYKITFPGIFLNHTKRGTQDRASWGECSTPRGSVPAPGVQPGFLLAQRGRRHQHRAVTSMQTLTQPPRGLKLPCWLHTHVTLGYYCLLRYCHFSIITLLHRGRAVLSCP